MNSGKLSTDQLCHLLQHPETGRQFSGAQWESAVHILREARLLATLAVMAEACGALATYPSYARRHLASARNYAARQAVQARFECDALQRVLDGAGVQPVFLKGAAYTLTGAAQGRGRIYSDIDLLVARDELSAAERACRAHGWYPQPLEAYDDRYYREWAHEVPPMWHRIRGTCIDVHHNIIPPVSGRAPAAERLLACAHALPDGKRVLRPHAAILHSVVHLLLNDDVNYALRDLVDLWQMFAALEDEAWATLVRLAEDCGFSLEVWYALLLVKRRFPTCPAPLEVMHALRPCHAVTLRRAFCDQVLAPALQPRHPELRSLQSRMAAGLVFLRGHWVKMPLSVLARHLGYKAFRAARDALFGPYQFEPERGAGRR